MVEGGGLENRFPVLRNGGSNPSPSANVAMLRGINNVGSKRVTMAALKAAFEAMGFKNVRTVLASGNVIFDAPGKGTALERSIAGGLEKALGFTVRVFVRTVREIRAIVTSDPFRSMPSGPDIQLYVTFLARKGSATAPVRLPEPPKNVRIVRVAPGEIYSRVEVSPGAGTPELMAFLDKALGQGGTTRNWRTVVKLAATNGRDKNRTKGDVHGS